MRRGLSRPAAGITTIEFAATLALLGIFAAFLLNRLAVYEELAEKTTVDITISQIRDGIRHDLIRSLLQSRIPPVATMLERNPVTWLAQPPQAYMGEFPALPPVPKPGAWYFLNKEKELVYVPKQSAHLTTRGEATPCLRWRLKPAGSAGLEALEGVRIDAQPAYTWF